MTENDDKRHLENVLRSLELPFLSALAEHQSEERLRLAAEREVRKAQQATDPKAEAAPSGSGSEGGGEPATGGISSTERKSLADAQELADDPTYVHIWVRASREQLDQYIDAVAHVIDHNCQAGHMIIDSFTGRMIEEMVKEAHTKGWYTDEISLMDSDEFKAYKQWLIDQEGDKDADSPEGEAGTD